MDEKKKIVSELVDELLAGKAAGEKLMNEALGCRTFAYSCGLIFALERGCNHLREAMKAKGADPEELIYGLRPFRPNKGNYCGN